MTADLLRELLQAVAASSVAVLLILALRRPLRHAIGAQAAYRVWLLVPAAVLAVWLPAPSLPSSPTSAPTLAMNVYSVAAPVARAAGVDLIRLVLAAWLAGAALCATVFAWQQRRFTRRIRRQPEDSFDRVEGDGPAVVGGWRVRVVLPEDFEQRYTPAEQHLVLAHELAHVRRGDLHAQSLATALRCLFWFNPLIHVGSARFRFDQELACDAAVLAQFPNDRRRYGDAMLKTQLALFGLPLACHWQSSHSLKERITMLKQPLPGPARRVAGALIAITLLASGGYTAWAAQPASPAATAKDAAGAPAPITRLHDDETLTTPVYPPEALAKGIEGKVVLDVLEGVDGRMREVKVFSAEPAGVFEAAAIAAARQWKLRPYLENGKPVERWWRVPVQFAKHDPDAAPVKAAETDEAAGGTVDAQSRAQNPPRYPAAALARAEDGKVVLVVDYDSTGKPTAIKVVDSEPAGAFDAAVLATAWKWRFTPAIENGRPVAGRARVPVTFKATDPATDEKSSVKS